MMDGERLEDIKATYQWIVEKGIPYTEHSDIDWLIEKAELAIELEEEVKNWRKVKDATVKLVKENERYKKALKSIKNNYPVPNEEFIPVEMIYEINLIVREALEGKQ